jgi:hypothetical protein
MDKKKLRKKIDQEVPDVDPFGLICVSFSRKPVFEENIHDLGIDFICLNFSVDFLDIINLGISLT